MKRAIVVLAAIAATAAAAYAGDGQIHKARGAELVKDSYIVVFNSGAAAPEAVAEGLARTHGGKVSQVYSHALHAAHFEMTEGQARGMAHNPLVVHVEQDAYVYARGDQANPPWNLDRIDQRFRPLDGNYHWDYDGGGVRAYVIDTGIRTTHREFRGRAFWGIDCTGEGLFDGHGHGTHVAGTIGGSTYGVAKKVGLYAVKVLNRFGSGTIAGIICGVDFVTAEKEANPWIPMVANMSLGGAFSQSLNDAVHAAVTAGVFFSVVDCNLPTDDTYAIGASSPSDTVGIYEACVDIFAPGVSILSAWNQNDKATMTLSGTSTAAPHAAGAAALVLQQYPTWTAFQVMDELTARGTPDVLIGLYGPVTPNLLLYTLP